MDLAEALRRKIDRDVEQALPYFQINPERNGSDLISRFRLTLPGVVGGGRRERIYYTLVVTLDGYPFVCPRAWIEKPAEAFIYHMQIWHPRQPLNLPEVCISAGLEYQKDWSARRIADGERNILGFLRQIFFMLNNENNHSKARE